MYKLLLKLIPKKIKNKILASYKEIVEREHDLKLKNLKIQQFDLPRLDLEEKHIRNLKMVKNRESLLELLPKKAVSAEIGVDVGDFSQKILEKTNPEKLYLIDVWDTPRYNISKKEKVIKRFNKEIMNNQVEVRIGYSTEILEQFSNNYFHWLYIDTDHTYLTTKKELEIASKKVIDGGIICGHDYSMGNWVKGYKYGVIEAVHEFCVQYNWEILYLTIEQSIPPSYAIRKIEKK